MSIFLILFEYISFCNFRFRFLKIEKNEINRKKCVNNEKKLKNELKNNLNTNNKLKMKNEFKKNKKKNLKTKKMKKKNEKSLSLRRFAQKC